MGKLWEDFKFGVGLGLGLVVALFVAKMISAAFSQSHFPW